MKSLKQNYKNNLTIYITLSILVVISFVSLMFGEYEITFKESLLALLGSGNEQNISIIWDIRLPRIIAGSCVGATLALSGLFCTTALKNPLADSGILGIQSGATTFALIIILIYPSYIFYLPLVSFIGGLIAFLIIMLVSYNGNINTLRLVLSGVAINAFFGAIIGIITIFNSQEIQNALNWLNGSLVSVSYDEMKIILIYSTIIIIGSFLFIPILKILVLDNQTIISLGKNPNKYRIMILIYAVLMASISVAFVGIISFIGIIIPKLSKILIGTNLKYIFIESILLGAILVIGADLFQRTIFAPMEIPVGIVIGLIGTPMFLFLLRRTK